MIIEKKKKDIKIYRDKCLHQYSNNDNNNNSNGKKLKWNKNVKKAKINKS